MDTNVFKIKHFIRNLKAKKSAISKGIIILELKLIITWTEIKVYPNIPACLLFCKPTKLNSDTKAAQNNSALLNTCKSQYNIPQVNSYDDSVLENPSQREQHEHDMLQKCNNFLPRPPKKNTQNCWWRQDTQITLLLQSECFSEKFKKLHWAL